LKLFEYYTSIFAILVSKIYFRVHRILKMAGFSIINHNGKEIVYLDYRGLNEDQIVEALEAAESHILTHKVPFRNLTNFTGAFATKRMMERAELMSQNTRHLSIRGAIVGLTAAKVVMLKGFNRKTETSGIQPFETEEEAMEYLTR
jgi:hypothetical protein